MSAPFDLNRKTFLVTGASSGIGKMVCKAIFECNGKFIAVSRREERLVEVISSTSTENTYVSVDLSKSENVRLLVDGMSEKIDGVVHCAGISKLQPLGFYNNNDYENITSINIDSIVFLMNALVKKRRLAKESSIVLISSISAFIGGKGGGVYASTKGALNAVCKVWANELSSSKTRVNCVAPGIVRTELTNDFFNNFAKEEVEADIKKYPLGYGNVEDVAYPVVFLLSSASKWITGQTIILDGGRSVYV